MITLGEISTGIIKVLREHMEIDFISEEDLSNTDGEEFLHVQL